MSWTTPSKKARAREVASKPGEAVQGQFTRVRDEARKKRHEELVSVIGSVADDVRAGLQPTLNGIRVTAARAFPVNGISGQRIAASNGRLVGWSLANTSATNGVLVRFRAGRDITGDVIAVTVVPAGGTSTMRVGTAGGVSFGGDGLTIEVAPVAGSGQAGGLEGSLHIGEVD